MGLRKNSLDDAKTGWQMLERNLDKVQALTMNMLAYSKPRRPTLELTHVPHVLNECLELVRTNADAKKVTLLTEISTTQPPIPIDADGIHQAVLNLLVNAIDAVPANRGVVTLSAEYDAVSQMTIIEVQDNGVGIAEKEKERIFQPFWSTKGQRGTGLGLAVTRKIVEEHNGTIDVISKVGQGTTFRIALPMNPVLPGADQTHGPANR
jgi:signal transduction histidine kinase